MAVDDPKAAEGRQTGRDKGKDARQQLGREGHESDETKYSGKWFESWNRDQQTGREYVYRLTNEMAFNCLEEIYIYIYITTSTENVETCKVLRHVIFLLEFCSANVRQWKFTALAAPSFQYHPPSLSVN